MVLTKEILQALDGREFVYAAKSLIYKVVLTFSYQFDEDRFIAAAHLEVRSFGKLLHEEVRSSRYFTKPQICWSDFTYNGKIIRPPSNAFDLCLLPILFQLQIGPQVVAFIDDWKLWIVDISVNEMQVDTGKMQLEFKQGEDRFLQMLILHTRFAKNIRLERQ